MQVVEISGEKRDNFGKSGNKVLRKNGRIPAVIYSKSGVHHFSTTHKDLKPIVYTPDFKQADITIDGATHSCIMQEIQFHPVTDAIVHIDFIEMVGENTIKVELPVRFEGTSPGVIAGGKLIQSMRRVKVKCTPKSLVDHLMIDISNLELGNVVRVRDINLPEGMEVMTNEATPVAGVEIPRALKSAEAAAEAEGAAAEPAEATEE